MAAPNIVSVTTITGVTTYFAGINTEGAGSGGTVIVSNAAGSGKVFKVNTLLAAGIGATTGVTVKLFDGPSGVGNSVAIGVTLAVPTYSTLAVIGKENSIYLPENASITAFRQTGTEGTIDIVCTYEDIS